MAEAEWEKFGRGLTVPFAYVTFIAVWWHCAAQYGFLLGFGLGWLPAGILALLVAFAVYVAWPAAIAVLTFGAIYGIAWVGTYVFGWW